MEQAQLEMTSEGAAAIELDEVVKPELGNSLPVSILAGAMVAACLVMSQRVYGEVATVATWGGIAFLALVAQQDVLRRKIPNWLTGPGLLLAIGYGVWVAGLPGLWSSLIGAGLPFILLVGFYAAGAMGAGDVKALMVLGALWGVWDVVGLMIWAQIIGGALGFLIVTLRGELLGYLRRWGQMLKFMLTTARIHYIPPSEKEAAASGLPFGLAIGLGVVANQIVGGPWQ